MVASRWLLVSSVVCGVAVARADAPAQTATVGANEIMKITTPTGFVDDVVAYDNQRLAYIVADTATKAELHVVQLGCAKCVDAKQEIVVDVSPVTLRPTALRLVGQRAFVIGATEDGNQIAALVELAGNAAKPVYKLGPATHITLLPRDGKTVVALHKATATKTGTKHEVELVALESGKRIAKGKAFELDKDTVKKLDFHVNHWSDGWTRAGGVKGGEWVKKENQRSPDTEATYDLIAGKFVDNKPIGDLFEQRKRYQTLADANGQLDFFRMKTDNSGIEIWRRGVAGAVALDQPLGQYDPKSLQGVLSPDGTAWLAIKVDPVNAEAVARKKADPEYLDVYRVGPDGKATRKARILAKGVRHRFGVIDKAGGSIVAPSPRSGDGAHLTPAASPWDSYFWLLEKSTGFDRGGRVLTVYQLQ